jgi:hypothetical protein
MKKLNYEIILYNIQNAREQLEEIENQLKDESLSESRFQIEFEHAYHHLNLSWNIRNCSTNEYRTMSEENYNNLSKFPSNKFV